jgi:hypothetical protein
MATQYFCGNENRRQAVREQAALNGFDYLEVASADQTQLDLFLVHPAPGEPGGVPAGPALEPGNFRIEGGVRIRGIRVTGVAATGHRIRLTVSGRGDFSAYTLRLVVSPTDDAVPPGFDPQLAAVRFSFKVACPSDFDCRDEPECPEESVETAEIDYLAKDYASFRRLMLDRQSVTMPAWRERNPADLQVMLTELLAYVGDHLSYYQDAVATEAYLGTARRRSSVRRHARLLDYFVDEGRNARCWVHIAVDAAADGFLLPAGTPLTTADPREPVTLDVTAYERLPDAATVFETMHDALLRESRNEIAFYTWSDTECCLPIGATRATLVDAPATGLTQGDLLLFEEVRDPVNGSAANADRERRHVVRLVRAEERTDPLTGAAVLDVEWAESDALPFALCLSAVVPGAGGGSELARTAVARGNLVLADHGRTYRQEAPVPAVAPERTPYRPRLTRPGLTFRVPYRPDGPAATALAPVEVEALPAITLESAEGVWRPQRDLLNSDRFSTEFVAEVESDGEVRLRFGDGVRGRRPASLTAFAATYRVGGGRAGNVGAEALGRIATEQPGILAIRNPLPARGGTDPESLEQVRRYAPEAFRVQQRAVTEADWAEVAQRHPAVQRASAQFRWTGSWHTVYVTLDRRGGRTVREDPKFRREILAHLDRFRLAGYDLELRDPVFVPLDLALEVCVKEGHFRRDVHRELRKAFSDTDASGFFHPDRFSFGDSVFVSRIYRRAMEVEGVRWVRVTRLQRWSRSPAGELEAGRLDVAPEEIARLDNDPNFPENGRLEILMEGGL